MTVIMTGNSSIQVSSLPSWSLRHYEQRVYKNSGHDIKILLRFPLVELNFLIYTPMHHTLRCTQNAMPRIHPGVSGAWHSECNEESLESLLHILADLPFR